MPDQPDLRALLDKFGVIIEFLKRDLEETRRQVREEFVTRREFDDHKKWAGDRYTQVEERLGEGRTALDDSRKVVLTALDDHKKAVGERCVSKDEFSPVKNVVYGLVGTILMAVIGALLVLVIRGGSP